MWSNFLDQLLDSKRSGDKGAFISQGSTRVFSSQNGIPVVDKERESYFEGQLGRSPQGIFLKRNNLSGTEKIRLRGIDEDQLPFYEQKLRQNGMKSLPTLGTAALAGMLADMGLQDHKSAFNSLSQVEPSSSDEDEDDGYDDQRQIQDHTYYPPAIGYQSNFQGQNDDDDIIEDEEDDNTYEIQDGDDGSEDDDDEGENLDHQPWYQGEGGQGYNADW